MLIPFAVLALSQTATPSFDLPPGTNAHVLGQFYRVQEALARGDFRVAEREFQRLPRREIRIVWDERAVPAARRAEFRQARDQAIDLWKEALPEINPMVSPTGDLKIGFSAAPLPAGDGGAPAGAAHLFSSEPGKPLVEAVIAIVRGGNRQPSEQIDIFNEVAFAIGAYLGLERQPFNGSVMGRRDDPNRVRLRVGIEDGRTVRAMQSAIGALRTAIHRRTRVQSGKPQVFAVPNELYHQSVVQGTQVPLSLMVTNRGNRPLRFRVMPDCGCFRSIRHSPTVAPGDSARVEIVVDTTEFPGELDKRLHIQSNDPETPVRVVPFRMTVQPAYRLLTGLPSSVIDVPKGGAEIDVFLAVPNPDGLKPTGARVDGIEAIVGFEPWKGSLADPEMGEPEAPRFGYRFTILVGPNLPPGRTPITLTVRTEHPIFHTLRYNLFLQQGIVAMPTNLYLGELGRTPARANLFVSRPSREFKVTSVSVDHPNLSASSTFDANARAYRVTVVYDGKADFGNLSATLTIKTDDPDQPTLTVPVSGVVR